MREVIVLVAHRDVLDLRTVRGCLTSIHLCKSLSSSDIFDREVPASLDRPGRAPPIPSHTPPTKTLKSFDQDVNKIIKLIYFFRTWLTFKILLKEKTNNMTIN